MVAVLEVVDNDELMPISPRHFVDTFSSCQKRIPRVQVSNSFVLFCAS